MTAEEAKRISFSVSKPTIAERDNYLRCVKNSALRGEYIFWENTFDFKKEALLLLKELGYRIFYRDKQRNVTGYPLYCIFWGEDESDIIKGFNGDKYHEL